MQRNNKILKVIAKQKPNPLLIEEVKGSFCFSFILDYCKTINCRQTELFCNECNDCKKINDLKYFDLHIIDLFNGTASKNEVLDIVNGFKYSALESSGNKFLIFKGIENANKQITNLMLRSIENPNKNTYYIFVTRNINMVLETIKSRCFMFRLDKQKDDVILKLENANVDKKYFNFLNEAFYNVDEMIEFYNSSSFKTITDIANDLVAHKENVSLFKRDLAFFKNLTYSEIEKMLIYLSLDMDAYKKDSIYQLLSNLKYKLNKTLIFNEIINII